METSAKAAVPSLSNSRETTQLFVVVPWSVVSSLALALAMSVPAMSAGPRT